jgi:predicted Zn-ribbon and HTH transcriptional regulator
MKIKLNQVNCKRCGYSWVPRKLEITVCAKCHSPWFDKEKINAKNNHKKLPNL